MTAKELNRDVARLYKRYEEIKSVYQFNQNSVEFYNKIDNEIISEFKRLYFADWEFTCFNKKSILILLRLNLILRIIPLHQFGIHIKLEEL